MPRLLYAEQKYKQRNNLYLLQIIILIIFLIYFGINTIISFFTWSNVNYWVAIFVLYFLVFLIFTTLLIEKKGAELY